MMKKLIPYSFLTILLLQVSCLKDVSTFHIPEFYTFERLGATTVDFNGQTTRILMGEELSKAMLDFTKSENQLLAMFANQDQPFSSNSLNQSSKSLKSKVASSFDFFNANTTTSAEIKEQFEKWISLQIQEIGADSDKLAIKGSSGQLVDGSTVRYVGKNGLEYNQAVVKGIIGALMLDQIANNYLSRDVLDAGSNRQDNDQELLVSGKTYTNMEHKWDEAYGYVFGTSLDAANPLATLGQDDSFFNKYLGRVDSDSDFTGIADEIFNAFKSGRAAIVAKDYEERDRQIEILRKLLSKVIGIRAVYYLQQGKTALIEEKFGTAFHDLSEGIGFIYSLQFTRIPNTSEAYFERETVENYMSQLLDGYGFWEVSKATLDRISQEISDRFDFSLEEAGK